MKDKNAYIKFLKRPIAVSMVFIILIILGAVSLNRLSVSLLPELNYPKIVIYTRAEGLSALEIEEKIIIPQESRLASLAQVKNIEAVGEDNYALLILTFTGLPNLEKTYFMIKDKLANLDYGNLPGIEGPSVLQYDPNTKPIAVLSLTSDDYTIEELTRLAEDLISRRINQMDGVGKVSIEGGSQILRHFYIDKASVEELDTLPGVVEQTLAGGESGLGTIMEGRNAYPLRILSGQEEELGDYIVPGINIELEDLGAFEFEKERDGYISFNGKQGIALIVEKRYEANAVKVVEELEDVIKEIKNNIGRDQNNEIDLSIVFHEAGFLKSSLDSLFSTLTIGILLTLIVLFICLGSVRLSVCAGISIPVSVVSSFFLFHVCGISLNIMSLGGLVLGIGMMIDNSIIVAEAFQAQTARCRDKYLAAFAGVKEVAAPVTASTLTTIAVFIPIIFLKGAYFKMFFDLAFSVSVSLLFSLLSSLTLLPVLLAGIGPSGASRSWNLRIWEKCEKKYFRVLFRLKKIAPIILLLFFCVFALSVFIGTGLPRELLPGAERGRIRIDVGLNKSFEQEDPFKDLVFILDKFSEYILKTRDGKVLLNAGRSADQRFALSLPSANKGYILIELDQAGNTNSYINELNDFVQNNSLFAGCNISIYEELNPVEEVLRTSSKSLKVRILSGDYGNIPGILPRLEKAIEEGSGLKNPEITGMATKDEYFCLLNREFLSVNNIRPSVVIAKLREIFRTAAAERARGPINISLYERNGINEYLDTPVNIGGTIYPLKKLTSLELRTARKNVLHIDRLNAVELDYPLPETRRNQSIAELRETIETFSKNLNDDIKIEISGEEEEISGSFSNLLFAFVLALALVYMIMAAQFESLFYPVVIIITVPMAIIGAVLILLITNNSINIMSLIGFVVAVGIVINDSIILTSAIIDLKTDKAKERTAFYAARRRFKPIVVTTLTTVAGMAPMAAAGGAADKLSSPIALTIIGGLSAATALTLIALPLIYSIVLKRPGAGKS